MYEGEGGDIEAGYISELITGDEMRSSRTVWVADGGYKFTNASL